jgi:hypothetical protein
VTRRHWVAVGLACLLALACNATARRLRGQWESEALPKRTLALRADGSFARRFSGKTLGFLSDVAGAEQGTWRVDGDALVLTTHQGTKESTEKLPIKDLGSDSMWLGGERWLRLP